MREGKREFPLYLLLLGFSFVFTSELFDNKVLAGGSLPGGVGYGDMPTWFFDSREGIFAADRTLLVECPFVGAFTASEMGGVAASCVVTIGRAEQTKEALALCRALFLERGLIKLA